MSNFNEDGLRFNLKKPLIESEFLKIKIKCEEKFDFGGSERSILKDNFLFIKKNLTGNHFLLVVEVISKFKVSKKIKT